MKITLKRACLIGGKHCDIGETVDVPDFDGRYLVNSGSAVEAAEEKKPARRRKSKAA